MHFTTIMSLNYPINRYIASLQKIIILFFDLQNSQFSL